MKKISTNKRIIIIALATTLLIAAVVLTVFLVNKNKNRGLGAQVPTTDKYGQKIEPYTDAKGNASFDEQGNLIVIVTEADGRHKLDENGQLVTAPTSEPVVFDSNDFFENRYMKIPKMPDWDNMGTEILMLRNEKLGAKLDIMPTPANGVNLDAFVESFFSVLNQKKEDFTINELSLPNIESKLVKIVRPIQKEDGTQEILVVFFFTQKDNNFMISGTAPTQENFDAVGYESILSEIRFK